MKRSRAWMAVLGVLLIVAGIAGAVALCWASGQRLDNAIEGLARAPVGCDTVLDFDRAGEFLLFTETSGRIDEVRGDCGADGEFQWDGDDDLPVATLVLTDDDGNDVPLDRDSGISYDGAGSTGELIRSVNIDEPGDYTLRVESDDTDFAIAVGTDPNDGVGAMRWAALAALLLGLAGGVALLAVSRGGRSAPTEPDPVFVAPPAWPTSPPGFPAPPPTTGATGAVGPPIVPPVRPTEAPLPTPPGPQGSPSGPRAGSWAPPAPGAQRASR